MTDLNTLHPMKDPVNPSHQEIRSWAYSAKEALEPMEDWDLIITEPSNINLIFELASDQNCPTCGYFLECLYLFVGDYSRAHRSDAQWNEKIVSVIELGRASQRPSIQLWSKRAVELIQNPSLFNYEDWCAGRLARNNLTE